MKRDRKRIGLMRLVMLTIFSATAASAFGQGGQMMETTMMEKGKPTVVMIRADWCGACKQIEPWMKDVVAEYKDRINFVTLDVTNEEVTARSAAIAKQLGLSEFFEANKKKTSTIAVFIEKGKTFFKTDHNYDRAAYAKTFDEAIAKARAMVAM